MECYFFEHGCMDLLSLLRLGPTDMHDRGWWTFFIKFCICYLVMSWSVQNIDVEPKAQTGHDFVQVVQIWMLVLDLVDRML